MDQKNLWEIVCNVSLQGIKLKIVEKNYKCEKSQWGWNFFSNEKKIPHAFNKARLFIAFSLTSGLTLINYVGLYISMPLAIWWTIKIDLENISLSNWGLCVPWWWYTPQNTWQWENYN
jgi:hypothetical protein